MQGSVDGTNFEILDTVTDSTSWSAGETRTFICDNFPAGSFNYFKLNITANNGGPWTEFTELYLYERPDLTHGTTTTTTSTSSTTSSSTQSTSTTLSTSTSTTTSTTLPEVGPYYCWGHSSPDGDEFKRGWALWKHADGSAVGVTGDADYGKLQASEPCYGPVVDLGVTLMQAFTVQKDKYSVGSGAATISIRGSTESFLWNDAEPDWEVYTGTITRRWRYVQLKVEEA
jgi:hypothetical protein